MQIVDDRHAELKSGLVNRRREARQNVVNQPNIKPADILIFSEQSGRLKIVICPKGSKCFFTEAIPEELLGRAQKVFHIANLLESIADAVNRVFLSPRIEVPAENLKNFESSHEFYATSRENRKKGDFDVERIKG